VQRVRRAGFALVQERSYPSTATLSPPNIMRLMSNGQSPAACASSSWRKLPGRFYPCEPAVAIELAQYCPGRFEQFFHVHRAVIELSIGVRTTTAPLHAIVCCSWGVTNGGSLEPFARRTQIRSIPSPPGGFVVHAMVHVSKPI
jgi:hypothetical protein